MNVIIIVYSNAVKREREMKENRKEIEPFVSKQQAQAWKSYKKINDDGKVVGKK